MQRAILISFAGKPAAVQRVEGAIENVVIAQTMDGEIGSLTMEVLDPSDVQRREEVALLRARVLVMEGAIAQLRAAWDRLCTCVDEFEPEDMQACGECRDRLDMTIVDVLKTTEEDKWHGA